MPLKDIILLIQSVSGHPCHKSYYHLALAVYYCCDFQIYHGFCLDRQIYPLISDETELPVKSISRSISRAVCDCWDYGNREKLDQIASRHLTEKPTPKEFIVYLCSYLMGIFCGSDDLTCRLDTASHHITAAASLCYPFSWLTCQPERQKHCGDT